ncbi:hypothetical protein [Oligoflexus tunisiensis]|uniref:hypothetical protein n=1 Tax=Oligoflexus tunisiensis TaxID=708132 RepID=UPI00159EF639|nr:hypothetical protein [Oligoflexus tunisiensis]
MIYRVLREFSYSMNRDNVPLARQEPEADEIPESGYKRLRMRPIPRRVQGEAISTFNQAHGRKTKKSDLGQSTNPFSMTQKTTPSQKAKTSKSTAAVARILDVGDRLEIKGKEAILTKVGTTKFEVLPIGCKKTKKFKFSEFPHFTMRQHKIWIVKEEDKHAAV